MMSLYKWGSQLFLLYLRLQLQIGMAISVFYEPWRILMISPSSQIQNLDQIYLMFLIEQVHLSSLYDQIISVITTLRRLQLPKICDFLYNYPEILTLLAFSLDISSYLTQILRVFSFSMIILANNKQRSSLMSLQIDILHFISAGFLLRDQRQVKMMHLLQLRQDILILMILMRLILMLPLLNYIYPLLILQTVSKELLLCQIMHLISSQLIHLDWAINFICSFSMVNLSFFLKIQKVFQYAYRSFDPLVLGSIVISLIKFLNSTSLLSLILKYFKPGELGLFLNDVDLQIGLISDIYILFYNSSQLQKSSETIE